MERRLKHLSTHKRWKFSPVSAGSYANVQPGCSGTWCEASFFFPLNFLCLSVIYIYKYNAQKTTAFPMVWISMFHFRFGCHLSHTGQLSIVIPIKKPPKYSQYCRWMVRLRVRVFLLLLRLLSYLSSFSVYFPHLQWR